jgi:hypothetical protein
VLTDGGQPDERLKAMILADTHLLGGIIIIINAD